MSIIKSIIIKSRNPKIQATLKALKYIIIQFINSIINYSRTICTNLNFNTLKIKK